MYLLTHRSLYIAEGQNSFSERAVVSSKMCERCAHQIILTCSANDLTHEQESRLLWSLTTTEHRVFSYVVTTQVNKETCCFFQYYPCVLFGKTTDQFPARSKCHTAMFCKQQFWHLGWRSSAHFAKMNIKHIDRPVPGLLSLVSAPICYQHVSFDFIHDL